MATPNPLVEELLKQPREVREAAVIALLDSLDSDDDDELDPEVEEAWRQEIIRRLDDNEPGIPAEIVFAELDAELDKRR